MRPDHRRIIANPSIPSARGTISATWIVAAGVALWFSLSPRPAWPAIGFDFNDLKDLKPFVIPPTTCFDRTPTIVGTEGGRRGDRPLR